MDSIDVSFLNPTKISVMKFDGNKWNYVGKPEISTSTSYYDFKLDNRNRPVIVFEDKNLSGRLTAMYFNGISWQTLGDRGLTSERSSKAMKISFDKDNRAHVLYGTFDFKKNQYKMRIQIYNGKTWVQDPKVNIEEKLSYSPIITDYIIDKYNIQYFAYGFQANRVHGINVFSYDNVKIETLINNKKYPEYSNPSIAVNDKATVFVLCSSFLGEKNVRVLNIIELRNDNISKIGLKNEETIAYLRKSNLSLNAPEHLSFLFTKYTTLNEVAVTLVDLNNGKLEIKGNRTFRSVAGISETNIILTNTNIPYLALLLFR